MSNREPASSKLRNASIYTICIFIGILIVTQICFAQPQEKSLFDLSFEELMALKISGSTRRDETLSSVPSAATVFTGREIRRMGISNAVELINFVPGYQSYRVGETASTYTYSCRGRRLGTSGREVLILLDGQRLNSDWSGGPLQYQTLLSTENIQKIEFIRGPGSALYGSNAFLGVINIVTDRELREVGFAVGSYEAQQGHVNWYWEKDGFKLNLFARYFRDHGEKYSDVYDTINGGRTASSDPRRGEDLYVSVSSKGLRLNAGHVRGRRNNFYILDFFSNQYNWSSKERSFVNLSHAWDWTERIHSNLRISYIYSKALSGTQLSPGAPFEDVSFPPSTAPLLAKTDTKELEPALYFHTRVKLKHGHDLQFGGEYRRPRMDETSLSYNYDFRDILNSDLPIQYYGGLRKILDFGKNSARRIWALYTQHQFSPWQPLTITSGIRYDHYSDFGHSTSLRLGAVYRAFEQTTFKLLYGEAFRAPTRNETDFRNNPVYEGNPDLDPEKSKTWELIWMHQFARGNLCLTWFHTRITDSIFQGVLDGNNNQIARVNGGDERSEGIELELYAELTEELTLRSSFTHLFHKPDSGFREAKNLASVILNYQRGKWNVNLSGYYHGKRRMVVDDAGRKRLEDYVVVNCKVQYEVLPGLKLFGQINNLTDKDYYTPSETGANRCGIPNRRQHFLVGIQKEF